MIIHNGLKGLMIIHHCLKGLYDYS